VRRLPLSTDYRIHFGSVLSRYDKIVADYLARYGTKDERYLRVKGKRDALAAGVELKVVDVTEEAIRAAGALIGKLTKETQLRRTGVGDRRVYNDPSIE
jgi:hypothetical protein